MRQAMNDSPSQHPGDIPQNCVSCGSALTPRWAPVIDPQTRERFTVLGCPACGLGHTSPRPTDLDPYYGAQYYQDGKRHGFSEQFRFRQRLGHVLREKQPPARLLDLGCGSGGFLQIAAAAGFEVRGTDRGEAAMIAGARGLSISDHIGAIPDTRDFDVITAWHSLEHFADPADELRQARAVIASDGCLVLAVPDAGGWQARFHGRFGFALDVPRHLYHFDEGSLRQLLRASGFAVDTVRHQEIEFDIFGWMQSSLNAILPTPNLLFGKLTGAAVAGRTGETILSFLLGSLLFPFALLATLASTAARRGGTLVVVARPTEAPNPAPGSPGDQPGHHTG